MTHARRTSALLAAGLLALAACSGGDDAAAPQPTPVAATPATAPSAGTGDAAEITALARYVASATAPADICQEKFSAKLVSTVFHTVRRCKKALKSADPADIPATVTVSDVQVSGLAGTAKVTEHYDDDGTVRGTWAFLRAGDQWRVAAWGVDYLRSGFAMAFGPTYEPEGPLNLMGDASARACLSKQMQDRSDAAFTRLAHGLLSLDAEIVKQVQDDLITCAVVPDPSGVSPLRRLFESGLRSGAERNARPELTDCLVRRTRSAITDQHLADVERSTKRTEWLDRRVRNVSLDCALAKV